MPCFPPFPSETTQLEGLSVRLSLVFFIALKTCYWLSITHLFIHSFIHSFLHYLITSFIHSFGRILVQLALLFVLILLYKSQPILSRTSSLCGYFSYFTVLHLRRTQISLRRQKSFPLPDLVTLNYRFHNNESFKAAAGHYPVSWPLRNAEEMLCTHCRFWRIEACLN